MNLMNINTEHFRLSNDANEYVLGRINALYSRLQRFLGNLE